jgi:hypothetical protein
VLEHHAVESSGAAFDRHEEETAHRGVGGREEASPETSCHSSGRFSAPTFALVRSSGLGGVHPLSARLLAVGEGVHSVVGVERRELEPGSNVQVVFV